MKIVQVNTYDIQGGAARAAYRLHKGLLLLGQDSTLLSKYRVSADPTVQQITAVSQGEITGEASLSIIQAEYINSNRTQLSNTLFSLPYPGVDLSALQTVTAAEIINLHWVADFQSPVTLKRLFALGKPVVWTLHDMWAFTGGCHYSAGCQNYLQGCQDCPQLKSDPFQLAATLLKDKLECFAEANLTIVTPSQWLADCAKQSQLFKSYRVEVIPYSLETHDLFTPIDKSTAKQLLGISPHTTTLLFGAGTATEARKGFAELVQATQHCLENSRFRQLVLDQQLEIICFGYPSELLTALEVPVRSLGAIDSDHHLRQIYSAADLFILPSLEDNLPNTMLEAMSCGTPVIGFEVGGIPDLVKNNVTGRVVPYKDTQQLAEAMIDCIFDSELRSQMGLNSRNQMVEHHAMPIQAERYLKLYQELLAESQPNNIASQSSRLLNGGKTMSGEVRVDPVLDTAIGPSFAQIAESLSLNAALARLQQTETSLEQLKTDFQQSQLDLRQTQSNLQHIQAELQRTQSQLQQTQSDLDQERLAVAKLSGALSGEQQTSALLRDQLVQSEVVRSRVIQELRQSNQHLKHEIQQIHESYQGQIQELNQSTRELRKQLRTEIRALTQQNAELHGSVEHLERELEYLSTAKATVRKIAKGVLRRLGLYNFAYKNYGAFVPVYNFFLRDKWKPATIVEPIAAEPNQSELQSAAPMTSGAIEPTTRSQMESDERQQPELQKVNVAKKVSIDMEASLVEAVVLARDLGMAVQADADLAKLKPLVQLISDTRSMLCIKPQKAIFPLLQVIAKKARVVCVGCDPQEQEILKALQVEVITQDLGMWMMRSGQTDLGDYDVVCLNNVTDEENLRLLKGRLAPGTKIVLSKAVEESFYG